MADGWQDRIKAGGAALRTQSGHLSASAREAAEGAGARIGEVYGQVRGQVSDISAPSREQAERLADLGAHRASAIAETGRKLSSKALRNSRAGLDRAALASRGLVAERPLTAVVVGIGAGVILGLLANRLVTTRAQPETDEVDDI